MAVGSVTSGTVVPSTRIVGEDSLSPVARVLKEQEAAKPATTESFTESETFIRAKVAQLKAQINTYSTLPGLDPSGAVIDSLTKEVNDLVGKQQAKLKKSQDEAAAKQKELDEANAAKKLEQSIPNAEQLLQRAKDRAAGKDVDPFIAPDDKITGTGEASGDVLSSDDMLKRAKENAARRGSTVNTTA